jgi:hypothetical protein
LREGDTDLYLACCKGSIRPLGEVRAAIAYGRDAKRSNIELATWIRRLGYEAGSFEPAALEWEALPASASAATRLAYEGFRLLLSLRWADYKRRPVPYSVRFCSAWTGLPVRAANRAIRELLGAGVIHQVEAIGWTRLYLPRNQGREDAVEGR